MVTVHLALCSFVVYVAVHKSAEIPQVAVHHGRRLFLRRAETDPHGPVYSASYLVVDVPVCRFSTGVDVDSQL